MTIKEYIQEIKPTIDRPYSLLTDAKKGAVIVETRQIKDFGLIVKNHLHFLPKGWGLTVAHSYENEKFIEEELKDVTGVNWLVVGGQKLDANQYNSLLTSKYFWDLVPYEKCLVFQSDSLLLRKGLERFEHYDYIGAPLYHIPFPSMNGGLSLRSKEMVLKCIKSEPYIQSVHGNEDIYYCKKMHKLGCLLPTKKIAQEFSVETIFGLGSLGVHAINKWHSIEKQKQILFQYEHQAK